METNEISLHEILVFSAIQASEGIWLSNHDLLERVPSVKPRTIRQKTRKLADLGLLDIAEVFPGHKFRLSGKAKQRNTAYLNRLEQARSVFGL